MDLGELKQSPSILANLDKLVKDELESSAIPPDAKIVVIDTFDLNGNKITVAVKLKETNMTSLKLLGVWQHEWDGDDTVAAKLVFVRK